ncbi:MAG: LEA type 2 family protein [Spirochaetia bacterium]|nr:LEA type 2 family protein [Spirochaetia bacterium]
MIKKTFIRPKITYEAMKIDKLELTGATIRLYVGIENKNNINMELSSIKNVVSLEGNNVLENIINDKVFIKAKDKTIVEFPVDLSFLGLKDNLKSIWKKQKIEYHVETTMMLHSIIGDIPIKIKYDDVINLPPIPDLKIEDVKVDKMGFAEMKMVFFVRVVNNKKIQLKVKDLTYDVNFNEFEIAKGTMDTVKTVIDSNDLLLEIPVNVQFLSFKRSITDMMKKGEINYDIHIYLNINSTYGDYILPMDKKGTAKLY